MQLKKVNIDHDPDGRKLPACGRRVEKLCPLWETSVGEKFNIGIHFSGKVGVDLQHFFDAVGQIRIAGLAGHREPLAGRGCGVRTRLT